MAPPADSTSWAWPAPKPLEGVKSKRRVIFKVEAAEARSDSDKVSRISGLSLALESRVAAVGEAGRAAVALLLAGEPAVSGSAWRQPGLVVVHLGPHVAGPRSDAKQHLAAATAAVQQARPHVVVLDEALPTGGSEWADAFAQLLRSEQLATFGGAVAVCCAEETFAVRRVCAERWAEVAGEVRQGEVTGRGLEVIEDVFGEATAPPATGARGGASRGASGRSAGKRRGGQDAELASGGGGAEVEVLLEEARQLSEFCFEEDLSSMAAKQGWTVTLLVEAAPDGSRALRGFLCHRLHAPPRAELQIERLAVPVKLRGRGYARQLMRWVVDAAARMPTEKCAVLTCSAFEKVVPFYAKIGFVPAPCPDQKHHKDDEDPQTWMELVNKSLLEQAAVA